MGCERCWSQVDNRITQEVYQLTMSISSMTWMVLRPMFDAVYCTILLVRVRLPPIAMLTMFGYGVFGVGLIRLFSPDFKKIAQEQERLSAELRTAHERVEQNSEAIAFQDGGSAEERIANNASNSVMAFLHRENAARQKWAPTERFMMWRAPYYIQQCEPPRHYRWHLGCILLKMGAMSLLDRPAVLLVARAGHRHPGPCRPRRASPSATC